MAAVILHPQRPITGLDDSKKLSEKKREALFPQIMERALAWHIEMVEAEEIDRLNILHATMEGMRRAVHALPTAPTLARIDGNRVPPGLPCAGEALIGGDALDQAIMAASILAKVARDRYMLELHQHYPVYGFAGHKGYPTTAHVEALLRHGPCPQHRRSFAPVRKALAALQTADVSSAHLALGQGKECAARQRPRPGRRAVAAVLLQRARIRRNADPAPACPHRSGFRQHPIGSRHAKPRPRYAPSNGACAKAATSRPP